MNQNIRRQDHKIEEQEAFAIIRNGEYGILSMCTPFDEGYGIPLNYALNNDSIYFHCAAEGSKLDCLRNNNKVSFCVVGRTEVMPAKFGTIYESAIVFGTTSEVEGDEKFSALMHIIEKYSGSFVEEGKSYIQKFYDKVKVVKLSIESVTGKARKQ